MELWWDPLLNMLSSGLQRLLGHPLMAGMCRIAHELQRMHTDDYRAYTMLMLQRSTTLLEAITGMTLAVRLGLLSSDGQQLVVQHLAGAGGTAAADEATAGPACVPAAAAAALPAAAAAELLQLKLAARDTIFSEAITANAVRRVADTSLYGQTRARPGADVFLGGDTEASLVVVPLQLGPGVPHKAALYVLHNKPGNFATAKRPICVLASMLQLLLHKQLQEGGLLTGVWRDAEVPAQDLQEHAVVVRAPPAEPAERQNSGTHASASNSQPSTASALVQMLQQQVRNNLQASQVKLLQAARKGGYLQELELKRVLGKGGFGIVYAGTWKGCPAAVKVMMVPKQQRRVMKGAMEMAVQESLSHPNIVRVFACLFDMVEEAVSVGSSSGFAPGTLMFNPAWLRFRPAGPEDMEAGAISNIMIMEYCEGGTLASAVRAGLVHKTEHINGRNCASVTMWKLLTVLLDVARSLEHVHRLSLLHCDLKPANVLLKTSPDSSLGLVAKLADFGLVKMMTNDRMYIRNNSVSGTITHLAPERFETGSRLTPAVDIYAFGMLMFEAYTRHRPFANLHPAGILQAVARGSRPEFPPGTPPPYQALAEACWAQQSEQRPTANIVVQQLQDMLARTNCPSVFAKRHYV
ncbi:hypothetical protein OEZ86_001129 [Tetradesmus obliquus]|nr:hypothetical protein OEZ86_001129 [Tetradesmus obliquus]